VARVTSCAFGAPDLDTLYITSARAGLTDEQLAAQPLAGCLFKVRPGVRGVPAFAYQG
jgi:sugar lactone lactonase YvrE